MTPFQVHVTLGGWPVVYHMNSLVESLSFSLSFTLGPGDHVRVIAYDTAGLFVRVVYTRTYQGQQDGEPIDWRASGF